MYLEVIVTSASEAAVAEASGADRVELVAEPDRGGLSPSLETVVRTVEAVRIPVHAMVRVQGRSFWYNDGERDAMLEQARAFAGAGVRGLVFGALTPDSAVDRELLADFSEAAGAAEVTFHRAFDSTADPLASFAELARFRSVTRVLTAGASADAWNGRALLRQLLALRLRLIVLAGGGIFVENVERLVKTTGVQEVHVGRGVRNGSSLDPRKIEAIASALRRLHRMNL